MIAVVAHDAGGAEILSSYARRRPRDFVYVLEGAARSIFERKLGPVATMPVVDAIRASASILCGTSWQSELEVDAIRAARALAKPSAAFLDHWVNYRERFERSGQTSLPDEIWVGDDIAEGLARQTFPDRPVRFVDNPYWEDIREEIAAMPRGRPSNPKRLSVLFVCEPIREHARHQFGNERHWGYVEEEALRFFLANVAALGRPIERIRIRPHPSESAGKYGWALDEFPLPIEMGGARALLDEVADSDVVVGCESMAMVVGLLAGKRVVSCVPPGGAPCRLPQPQITSLDQLLAARIQL